MSTCIVCHEKISLVDGIWTHAHGDTYCGTGDGAVAYPAEVFFGESQ